MCSGIYPNLFFFKWVSPAKIVKAWGVLTLKRVTGKCSVKNPFSRSISRSKRPPFHHLSVPQDPHFNQKSQNFPIFCSKCLILANFQFLILKKKSVKIQFRKLQFEPKISSESSILSKKKKISLVSPQIWSWSVLHAPIIGPLGRWPLPKPELSASPPRKWSHAEICVLPSEIGEGVGWMANPLSEFALGRMFLLEWTGWKMVEFCSFELDKVENKVYDTVAQGFFSKFLMGGTRNFRSPSVPDRDEVGWGGTCEKNPTEAKTAHLMQN